MMRNEREGFKEGVIDALHPDPTETTFDSPTP
jgi:hypothetical protein